MLVYGLLCCSSERSLVGYYYHCSERKCLVGSESQFKHGTKGKIISASMLVAISLFIYYTVNSIGGVEVFRNGSFS